MLEKDIENLIARYPAEFFPKDSLTLKGQQVKIGSCYADIIFTDKFDRIIIVEVKRGLLGRDAAGQIMEYYGLVKEENPDKTIELILCANTIPSERRRFLENVGIECKELGLSSISEIAQKKNYQFLDSKVIEDKKTTLHTGDVKNTKFDKYPKGKRVWIFQANPEKFDVIGALSDPKIPIDSWRVKQYKNELKKGDIALIWASGKDAGIYAVMEITSEPRKMPILPESEQYWKDQNLKADSELRVELKMLKNLVNKPLQKIHLKENRELVNLSIFRFAQGTAFPVIEAEWRVIEKVLGTK